MAKPKVKYGGGWAAVKYSWDMARKVGGVMKLWRSLRKKNTCKACAFGMKGMKNEIGHTFEICKKSMQAQAQDMSGPISGMFWVKNSLEDLENWSGRDLEAAGRLVQPLYAGPDGEKFKVLEWQEAYEILLKHWRESPAERSFFYASGRSSMEAAYLLHIMARQWGTNNVNNCSYYCHQASGVGLKKSLGGGTATVKLEDIDKADLLLIIGANPSSNHPRLIKFALDLRRRGGKVIIINPFRELGLEKFKVPSDFRSLLFGSEISDLYLQPHCGGDLALLKGAAARLHSEGKSDLDFLESFCEGKEEFLKDLDNTDWEALRKQSGVSRENFDALCVALENSHHAIFSWAMGVTQQKHGVETVQSIANLALLLGMIGKLGAGLMPIRGHSNVQGIGSVGVVPKLKPSQAEKLAINLGIEVPPLEGKDTFACLEAAQRDEIDFAFLLGGNLYGASPDLDWAQEAFSKIDFTVYLSTTLNKGHLKGRGRHTLILPVRARDEEKQSTTQESMFNYVRLSQGGETAPIASLPAESEILVHCARELFGKTPFDWAQLESHETIREFIAETVSHLKPIKDIKEGSDFTIPGRIKHSPEFNTESGKANLAVLKVPDTRPGEGKFNLMTFRSEGQFNTIVYEEEDIYRGVEHRMVVFMSKEDMEKMDLTEKDRVKVQTETGELEVEAVEGPIRSGNLAMYYPEANAIVPRKIDPQSKTPVFKRILATVEKV